MQKKQAFTTKGLGIHPIRIAHFSCDKIPSILRKFWFEVITFFGGNPIHWSSFMSRQIGKPYTIKAGETLFIVAQRELNKGNRWCEIMKPNGSLFTQTEAYNVQEGQEIYLPTEQFDKQRYFCH